MPLCLCLLSMVPRPPSPPHWLQLSKWLVGGEDFFQRGTEGTARVGGQSWTVTEGERGVYVFRLLALSPSQVRPEGNILPLVGTSSACWSGPFMEVLWGGLVFAAKWMFLFQRCLCYWTLSTPRHPPDTHTYTHTLYPHFSPPPPVDFPFPLLLLLLFPSVSPPCSQLTTVSAAVHQTYTPTLGSC